jgi:arginyl-tRNA synthetase
VDYIGANAGKPLHIGHLCTPSVGQAICNIHYHLGYKVIGDSHFGDWGGIFGKLIYAWKYEEEENIFIQLEKILIETKVT